MKACTHIKATPRDVRRRRLLTLSCVESASVQSNLHTAVTHDSTCPSGDAKPSAKMAFLADGAAGSSLQNTLHGLTVVHLTVAAG